MKPQPRAASSAAMEQIGPEEDGWKRRKRLTADERLVKNRERNKSHARKTRERKKNHMVALRARVEQLEEESNSLRSKVDARYTANVLLGLGFGPNKGVDGVDVTLRSSSSICKDLDKVSQEKQGELMSLQMRIEEDQNALLEMCTANVLNTTGTGIRNNQAPNGTLSASAAAVAERRAKGKYTPQERETIRRERNRIHAKKTRDKKKIFLESSEATIATLEKEVESLRAYLVSVKVMSADEMAHLEARDQEAQLELTALRDTSNSVVTDVLLQIRGDKSMQMAFDDDTTTGGSGSRSGSSHSGLNMSSRSSSSDISSGNSADAPTPTGTGTGSVSGSRSSMSNGGGAALDSSSDSRLGNSDFPRQHVDVFREGADSSASVAMIHCHSKGGGGSTTPPTDDDSNDAGISAYGVHNRSGHTSGGGSVITESASNSSRKRGQKRHWGYQDGDDHDNSNSNGSNSDNNDSGSSGSSGSTDGSHEGSSGSGKADKTLKKPASLQSLSVKHDASSDAKAAFFF